MLAGSARGDEEAKTVGPNAHYVLGEEARKRALDPQTLDRDEGRRPRFRIVLEGDVLENAARAGEIGLAKRTYLYGSKAGIFQVPEDERAPEGPAPGEKGYRSQDYDRQQQHCKQNETPQRFG